MSLSTVALLGALFVLALAPVRRLWLDGVRLGSLVSYLVLLLATGLLAIEARPLARLLVPALLVLYLFPYLGLATRWRRWRGRTDVRRGGGRDASRSGSTVIEGQATRIGGHDREPRG